MLIQNALSYNNKNEKFFRGDIRIENGVFAEIGENLTGEEVLNADGKMIVPGFIDIHTHGAAGYDFMSAKAEDYAEIEKYYLSHGVTAIFPTSASARGEDILGMIAEAGKAIKSSISKIVSGVHIEGPFINPAKAGAHDKKFIRGIDMDEIARITDAICGMGHGLKMRMTIAPDLDRASEAIQYLRGKGFTSSIGHTEADGETVKAAIEHGAVCCTHLFNAMPSIHHRAVGTPVHLLLEDIYVEIIADGVHLAPDIIKLVCRAKDYSKIILVSDSMEAAGLSDGLYGLGSSAVEVRDGKATVAGTDTIAGSTTNLYAEFLNFMKFTGIIPEKALCTVTKNPALAAGIYDKKGSVSVGKDADFIIADKNFGIKAVYVRGEEMYRNK